MIKNRKHPGSIILYTLMMLSIILLLMQQMMRGVFVGTNFTRTMVDRERAEMLALSGINIAIAQLTYDEKDDQEKKEPSTDQNKKNTGIIKGTKGFLTRIVPYLNRWQEFPLTQKIDGIDGLIRTCITCESGKININAAFDFTKMEFKPPYDIRLKALEIPGIMPAGEMLTKLTDFFKKRKSKLNDVSELLTIPGFKALDIFYKPPAKPAKGKKSQPNTDLALQDIFTIWSDNETLDLLWLSDALCAIIGVRRPHADDPQVRKERINQFLQNFKKDMVQDWDNNWKILENLYDQKPKDFAQIKNIFSKVFGPKVFSVLSCGKIGHVEQKIVAIIREEVSNDSATNKQKENLPEEKKSEQSSEPKKTFRILRIYWL